MSDLLRTLYTIVYRILFPIHVLILILNYRRFYFRKPVKIPDLTGKTILITGASAGLGLETAKVLAAKGARILMACRNMNKAQKAAEFVRKSTGSCNIKIYHLELSSMKSVRKCAAEILQKEDRLDVLLNNAGTGNGFKKSFTDDGLEAILASNYYGPFLLTNLLLDLLKKTESRIVNVTSSFHKFCAPPNLDDLSKMEDSFYNYTLTSYGLSKLCLNLFTVELSRKLFGTKVTANTIDPGFSITEIYRPDNPFLTRLYGYYISPLTVTPEESARGQVYLSTSEDVAGITGRHFISDWFTKDLNECALDTQLAKNLWDKTAKDVQL